MLTFVWNDLGRVIQDVTVVQQHKQTISVHRLNLMCWYHHGSCKSQNIPKAPIKLQCSKLRVPSVLNMLA